MTQFAASKGWFDKFRKQVCFHHILTSDESGSAIYHTTNASQLTLRWCIAYGVNYVSLAICLS